MNGLGAEGVARAKAIGEQAAVSPPGRDIAICPPAPLLAPIAAVLGDGPVALGGQDCAITEKGAHTGDVSAEMLADVGCRYVIVGHSERRADHGETDAQVRDKATAAHRAGLVAIVCLGETEAERDAGTALAVVERQLTGSLPDGAVAANTAVAYEPVWAIGTGRTPDNDQIAAVHTHLRGLLRARLGDEADGIRLLYGGSVKPANAADILALDDVDGALVGGASLDVEDFCAICTACP
jgi:triosephosphate isomerase